MHPITKPLSSKQLKKIFPDGNVDVAVEINFNQLVDNDIEGLNDLVDELICKDEMLEDIRYSVVGHIQPKDDGSGSVVVRVRAGLTRFNQNDDEDEEDVDGCN